jgi:alcohol dehydrogenase
MLLGAHLAGTAIENSMLGATHALANPLSAHFDTVHGVAIGILLPHVVRYNAGSVGRLYGDLAADAGLSDSRDPDAPEQLARHLTWLTQRSGQPVSLRAVMHDDRQLPQLSQEAAAQWTGTFNPRPVDASSLEELYRCALNVETN